MYIHLISGAAENMLPALDWDVSALKVPQSQPFLLWSREGEEVWCCDGRGKKAEEKVSAEELKHNQCLHCGVKASEKKERLGWEARSS